MWRAAVILPMVLQLLGCGLLLDDIDHSGDDSGTRLDSGSSLDGGAADGAGDAGVLPDGSLDGNSPDASPAPCGGGEVWVTAGRPASSGAFIAGTNDGFALAWTEENATSGTNANVVWLRLDGTPRGEPTTLGDGVKRSLAPALAWNESELAAAWTDGRGDGSTVYLKRFDMAGYLIGGSEAHLDSEGGSVDEPSVVWRDRQLVLAYTHTALLGPTRLLAAALTVDTGVFDSGVLIDEALGAPEEAELARVGDSIFAVWDYDGRPAGEPSGYAVNARARVPIPLGIASDDPSIAASESIFGVAYLEYGALPHAIVFAAQPVPDAPLSPAITVSTSSGGSQMDEAAIAWHGGQWGIAWQQGDMPADEAEFMGTPPEERVFFAAVRSGTATEPIAVSQNPTPGSYAIDASIAWSNDRWGVAWTDSRHGAEAIYFATVCP